MQFGEYCPVCDTFINLGLPRTEGDVITCPNPRGIPGPGGHKLVYLETDSQFMDCILEEYEKWVNRQKQVEKPGYA